MGTRSSNNANKRRDANPPVEAQAAAATGAEIRGKGYMGTLPKCDVCQFHYAGRCRAGKCETCGKVGHAKETCWYGAGRGNGGQRGNGNGNGNHGGNGYGNRNQGGNYNQGGNGNRGGSGNQAGNGNRGANSNQGRNGNGNGRGQGCFSCGDVGHFKRDCPKNNQAQGRVFNIGAREARQDPNVVTEFKNILGLVASKLDIPYSVELANGKLVEANKVIRGCVIVLGERKFMLDLLPFELGSFDVVVGMDWLSSNRAEIVCHEKIIRIPMTNEETTVIHGEKHDTPLRIISCLKT
ncbi:TSET complex member tstE-like [Helianthus annuus]|uniref:TSET complex member tstE-like n=1 Tax=Helianthus annuus TaxID=4232 RepID=UPI000B900A4F|nr:TSET complex member tstE-like [Helianthus annuus]